MTDRELMQQALEKLEFFAHMKSVSEDTMRLSTALRERLAQPEQPDELTIWKSRALQAERVIEKFMKPVQEPVATVVKRQYEDGTYAGNALDWAGRNCEDDFPVGTKLYTDPQPVKFNCTVVDADHPNGVPLSQWGKQQKQKPFCYHDGRNIVGKEYADHCDVFPLYTSSNPEQKHETVRFKCIVVDDAHPDGIPLSHWGKQSEMQPCAGRNCGSTNPNLHSAECFEDYEKATGMVAQQPGIEELEHENRLMRARNERLEAEVDRLERENFAWRTKLGVRGYEMQIEDLRAKLQGLLHYRSKP